MKSADDEGIKPPSSMTSTVEPSVPTKESGQHSTFKFCQQIFTSILINFGKQLLMTLATALCTLFLFLTCDDSTLADEQHQHTDDEEFETTEIHASEDTNDRVHSDGKHSEFDSHQLSRKVSIKKINLQEVH